MNICCFPMFFLLFFMKSTLHEVTYVCLPITQDERAGKPYVILCCVTKYMFPHLFATQLIEHDWKLDEWRY